MGGDNYFGPTHGSAPTNGLWGMERRTHGCAITFSPSALVDLIIILYICRITESKILNR